MIDLTGKKDALYLKDRYQSKINEQHRVVKQKRDFFYKMNHKLKESLANVNKYTADLDADLAERESLYESLQNLLQKETDFEEKMWGATQKGKKGTKVNVTNKIKDSEVDEVRIGAMQEYLETYPKYASKSSFSKILDKIESVEQGIKRTKNKLNEAVSLGKRETDYFPRNMIEFRDYVKKYEEVLKEGQEKLNNSRYVKGFLFKMATEEDKQAVQLDLINHNIHHFVNSAEQLEKEFDEARDLFAKMIKKYDLKVEV